MKRAPVGALCAVLFVIYGLAEGEVEVLGFGVVAVVPAAGETLAPGAGVILVLLLTLPTAAVIASAL